MTNALLSEQKKLDVSKIKILCFSGGEMIIGSVESSTPTIVYIYAPVLLITRRDDETGVIVGFNTEPFMAPYVEFDPETLKSISTSRLLSVDNPSEFVLKRYVSIVEAHMNGQDSQAVVDSLNEDEEIEGENPLVNNSTKQKLH